MDPEDYISNNPAVYSFVMVDDFPVLYMENLELISGFGLKEVSIHKDTLLSTDITFLGTEYHKQKIEIRPGYEAIRIPQNVYEKIVSADIGLKGQKGRFQKVCTSVEVLKGDAKSSRNFASKNRLLPMKFLINKNLSLSITLHQYVVKKEEAGQVEQIDNCILDLLPTSSDAWILASSF
uniref:AlNc14C15G1686 protein n=1 Tax=Albugo laibachii Nc14 TaxID=890382 RepID=F0W3Y7_9STRA|nr:AlNc14C15G1686 [Albugo laibachii Nc14]|eukprot:CCA15782.1 AlNc14C15G1686 [Albugo laibachii Nc14]